MILRHRHEVKVISIAQFTEGNTRWCGGAMLHRALQQFLADVYWGDLDVLLLDLPPGTGDIAISVVTDPERGNPGGDYPQLAAAESRARRQHRAADPQRIVGVVENMSGLALPDGQRCRYSARAVAGRSPRGCRGGRGRGALLGRSAGSALVAAGDSGVPIVLSDDSAVGKELLSIADRLSSRRRGLAGVSLGLDRPPLASPRPLPLTSRGCVSVRRHAKMRTTAHARGLTASRVAVERRVSGRVLWRPVGPAVCLRIPGGPAGCTGCECAPPTGAGLSKLPVKIESSPSSKCLVRAARGVIPRTSAAR